MSRKLRLDGGYTARRRLVANKSEDERLASLKATNTFGKTPIKALTPRVPGRWRPEGDVKVERRSLRGGLSNHHGGLGLLCSDDLSPQATRRKSRRNFRRDRGERYCSTERRNRGESTAGTNAENPAASFTKAGGQVPKRWRHKLLMHGLKSAKRSEIRDA
jgi:hypothetical protein